MNAALAQELIRQTVMLILLVSAPILLVSLLVGLLVTLFQTLTSLQEQTLTFIPKLLAAGAVLLVSLPWMMRQLVTFLTEMLQSLPRMAA